VPLWQHVMAGPRMYDLFADERVVNPELVRLAQDERRRAPHHGGRRRGPDRRSRAARTPWRSEVVERLNQEGLLPAIYFLFSRAGCDEAVRQCLHAGLRLTTPEERSAIRSYALEATLSLPDDDLAALGFDEWLEALERGLASHHAGLLPAFKEIVEALFQQGLIKVVFATETLALGINMPAKSVVLERLVKWNGETHVDLTPGEYTQLTGRAGRRGIDVEGHSVIQWTPGLDPQAVASLASRRTYPLNSSFRPTYNMAVNLIEQFGRQRTREVLESSFAQFQADRAVVDLARTVRKNQEALEGYARAMTCHLGDYTEYAALRRELSDLERGTKRAGEPGEKADKLRRQKQLEGLRSRMRKHPCHGCADREAHARWAERWWRLKRETDKVSRQITGRTGAVAAVFDRITEILTTLDYLRTDEHGRLGLTPEGRALRRIYGERDLLVAESLRQGLWNDLDAPGLAAMASAIVYEARRDDGQAPEYALPRGAFRPALERTQELWARLDDLEREHRLPGSEPLATTLALPMQRWASGGSLDAVLRDADLAAGDFVRWTKQTIDLLDQISLVADGPVGRTARSALDAIRRGIVAYSSVA